MVINLLSLLSIWANYGGEFVFEQFTWRSWFTLFKVMSLAFNAYFSSFKIGGHWNFLVFEHGLKVCLTSIVYYRCHAELLQIRGVANIQFTRILFHYSLCTFTRIFTSGSTTFISLSLFEVLSTRRSWKRALFHFVYTWVQKSITSLLIEVNLI